MGAVKIVGAFGSDVPEINWTSKLKLGVKSSSWALA
jgi:hypothetical protein